MADVTERARSILKILILILILILGIHLILSYGYFTHFKYSNQELIHFIASFHPDDVLVFIAYSNFPGIDRRSATRPNFRLSSAAISMAP